MPLFRAIQDQEDERRIMAAEIVLLLACVAPLVGFAYVSMEMMLGHGMSFPRGRAFWLGTTIALGWLALYGIAGYLVGERRATGGLLGIALFTRTIVSAAMQHRLVSLNTAYAALGIVLILRAGRVLRLPLFDRGTATP